MGKVYYIFESGKPYFGFGEKKRREGSAAADTWKAVLNSISPFFLIIFFTFYNLLLFYFFNILCFFI